MKHKYILLYIIIFVATAGVLTPVNLLAQLDEEYETSLLLEEEEDNEDVFNTVFKPIIGIGEGMFTFMGDVKDQTPFMPTQGQWGTKAVISRTLGKSFEFDLYFIFGNMSGEQRSYKEEEPIGTELSGDQLEERLLNTGNKNFTTEIMVSGVAFTYNFINVWKRKRPILPFISIGIETLQFRPKTDLYYTDANGNQRGYAYWSDGTIRNIEEGSGNQPSVVISRDHIYETDARNATNQDYSFFSFGIPLDFGINITISDRLTLRAGNAFHFTFTDYIDNHSEGDGILANDHFNYAYASLRLDMFSPAEEIVAVENFKNIKFTVTDNEDQDNDGVDDFNDECPNTEPNVEVDFRGCPFDDDRDGIPNYKDKQKETTHKALGVRDNGIRILDMHVISMLYEPEAVKRKDLYNYYKKSSGDTKEYDEIPDKFKHLDVNNDDWISPKELQKAINDFFDFKSKLKADDIYELKEYFFHQK